MTRNALSAIITGLLIQGAYADIVIQVDLVDPSDAIHQPPAGILAVDGLVDVVPTQFFSLGGIRVESYRGAILRYVRDPNNGAPLLVNPGTDNRFVTFFSQPRPRDGGSRFNNSGAHVAFQYCPAAQLVPA